MGYKILRMSLGKYIKAKRKLHKITQPELAIKAGVGLRFIRDMEQGKTTLRMDKVNDVLRLFGEMLGPVSIDREKLIEDATKR
ncbi:MAG: Helix-turn-helix domain protein [Bacteroidetes bacterium ADurb.BinA245]|jgi:y4mF family transcriptional regulator|nr:MAG: Helix-turn-helix domain protein [Bacteroidetes bacterium ADurb.BinA245]